MKDKKAIYIYFKLQLFKLLRSDAVKTVVFLYSLERVDRNYRNMSTNNPKQIPRRLRKVLKATSKLTLYPRPNWVKSSVSYASF